MKNLYKYCAVAALALTATSCANFLEADPKGQLVTENFFQSQNDLEMAINALYFNVAYAQTNSNPTIPQLQGDDITSTTGSNKGAYLSADAFEEPSDYKGVEALWLNQYRIIQAANLVIDNADRVPTTEEYINMAKGNAYFWRACAYYQLVRIFGPLPINMHNEADDNKTPLTPVDKVYELIVSDLTTADSYNIPTTYDGWKYGHTGNCDYWVTRQAVKSVLASVYMSMAGYPLFLDGYYEKAADKAKEVIDGVNAGTYNLALESDWNQVYSCGNDWSAEQIMTISYYDSPGTMGNMGSYTSQFCKCHRFSALNNGWSDFVPERRWWANYPDGPRKNAVYDPEIYTYIKDSNGNVLMVNWWAEVINYKQNEPDVVDSRTYAISPRHPLFAPFTINADAEGAPIREPHDFAKPAYDGQSYPQNHRFIRYSEVLCWFAESAARCGKYTSEAQAALQQVIDRAYNSDNRIDASSLTGDALAKQAFLEHGYEVTGYPLSLVTRRSDQFRLGETATGVWADQTFKASWEYRHGEQNDVLVPAGTLTKGYMVKNTSTSGRPRWATLPYEYELEEDLRLKEEQPVANSWNGIRAMYHPYPPTEVEKNPNLVR
ncbi:MAG: RagB/SusD family nutrient uptake outer membrane protein [Muribaculaceae bacterium]|nr:RagB/SusD family nutrient uptake outer membrane protein [Muribaculaceae bacterium]